MSQTQLLVQTNEQAPDVNNLDELKSEFMRNVGRELRTPVIIIRGYAELLSEGSPGALAPEQEKALFAITNRANELHKLVERITTLLSVKAQIGDAIPLALTEIVESVMDAQRVKVEKAGLTLAFQPVLPPPLITGQYYPLRLAVDCLVENAIKFTPAGGQVEIRLATESGWVCLIVADTGIGIAEEELERIFDSFYQVDGSSTRSYGGLGLGLAVVKTVIEAYQGQIEVKSRPGQGSRFIVKFPALAEETRAEQIQKTKVGPHRILIVDDEESVGMILRDGLEKLPNCEIVTAISGQQALALFAEKPFDLLFTDYKMPDIDGLALAMCVGQAYPRTVIIMITAHSNEELYQQAAGASIQRILDKPVKLSEIRHVASTALNRSNGSQNETGG
jgi:CheY-like chemotaxis protein